MTTKEKNSKLMLLSAQIHSMDVNIHIEILRIIKDNDSINVVTENKNGCFIDMNKLSDKTIDDIENYITFNINKTKEIDDIENMKDLLMKKHNITNNT